MTRKTRGRTEATPKTSASCNPTPIHSSIKALIVRLAVWGLLPAGLAGWIIRRFHLGAA